VADHAALARRSLVSANVVDGQDGKSSRDYAAAGPARGTTIHSGIRWLSKRDHLIFRRRELIRLRMQMNCCARE